MTEHAQMKGLWPTPLHPTSYPSSSWNKTRPICTWEDAGHGEAPIAGGVEEHGESGTFFLFCLSFMPMERKQNPTEGTQLISLLQHPDIDGRHMEK